jgi:hypothetical protein
MYTITTFFVLMLTLSVLMDSFNTIADKIRMDSLILNLMRSRATANIPSFFNRSN